MQVEAIAHDLYVRYVDSRGNSVIREHRVWDALRFLDAVEAAAQREGGSVSVTSPMEYRKQQGWKEFK